MTGIKIRFINDWRYLFKSYAVGGRFAAFTFINISYMNVNFPEVDGFTVTLLGLGISIKPGNTANAR